MKTATIPKARLTTMAALWAAAIAPLALAQSPGGTLDRTVLPIPEPNYPHSTVLDARDAKAPPRFEIKAPAGAPNVIIVLVDDMGFGMSSSFGGPVRMPAADHLASQGLRYTQFHTTALCSPTRTARSISTTVPTRPPARKRTGLRPSPARAGSSCCGFTARAKPGSTRPGARASSS